MNKEQKIALLANAMTIKGRDNGEKFYCFSDSAPSELKDLYLQSYNVRDNEYQMFSDACDIISEMYEDNPKDESEYIYERADSSASIMTADRLAYLDIWNENEISENMRINDIPSIADACAYWYSQQVNEMCFIIKEWVENNQITICQ